MKKERAKTIQIAEKCVHIEGTRIGRITCVDECGHVLVDFPGNSLGPTAARTTTSAKAEMLRKGNPAGREVLLIFENNDPELPVIIDTMYSLIDEIVQPTSLDLEAGEPKEATIDGKRISFEAEEEIVLKCGKASITLTKAGKVMIKGE